MDQIWRQNKKAEAPSAVDIAAKGRSLQDGKQNETFSASVEQLLNFFLFIRLEKRKRNGF